MSKYEKENCQCFLISEFASTHCHRKRILRKRARPQVVDPFFSFLASVLFPVIPFSLSQGERVFSSPLFSHIPSAGSAALQDYYSRMTGKRRDLVRVPDPEWVRWPSDRVFLQRRFYLVNGILIENIFLSQSSQSRDRYDNHVDNRVYFYI